MGLVVQTFSRIELLFSQVWSFRHNGDNVLDSAFAWKLLCSVQTSDSSPMLQGLFDCESSGNFFVDHAWVRSGCSSLALQ